MIQTLGYSLIWLATIPMLILPFTSAREPPRWLWTLLAAGGLLYWTSLILNIMEP